MCPKNPLRRRSLANCWRLHWLCLTWYKDTSGQGRSQKGLPWTWLATSVDWLLKRTCDHNKKMIWKSALFWKQEKISYFSGFMWLDVVMLNKMRCFSVSQWYDALKAVARLPTGIPKEWRKRVCDFQLLGIYSIFMNKLLFVCFNPLLWLVLLFLLFVCCWIFSGLANTGRPVPP